MPPLKINMISESAFTVQGHGVHTAFIENYECLKAHVGVDIVQNSDRPADIFHIHTVGPYSLKKLLRGKGRKIVSAHVTPDSFVGSLKGAKYWYGAAKWYLRWFYNLADGVLAVSQEVVDELKRMGVRKPIYLVPNTIDTKQFTRTAKQHAEMKLKMGYQEGDFIIMSSGQVQPRKRVDTFINCAKALPEYQFVWVGGVPFKGLAAEGGEMADLMKQKLPNMRFTGMIDRADVVAYYQASDLFFLPSIQETFGIVIVEAAAAGMPVMLRDIAQYRITFKDWYVKGQEEDFVGLIKKLATDPKFYSEQAKQATKIAEAYDSKNGAERLLEVYRATLAAH